MNALETLGHYGFHAKKARALGSPVTAGPGSILLAGEDDERNSVGLIRHAGIVDKRRLSIRGLHFLVWRRDLSLAKVEGVAAFHAGNHQVLDSHVRECAARHDAIVAAA